MNILDRLNKITNEVLEKKNKEKPKIKYDNKYRINVVKRMCEMTAEEGKFNIEISCFINPFLEFDSCFVFESEEEFLSLINDIKKESLNVTFYGNTRDGGHCSICISWNKPDDKINLDIFDKISSIIRKKN